MANNMTYNQPSPYMSISVMILANVCTVYAPSFKELSGKFLLSLLLKLDLKHHYTNKQVIMVASLYIVCDCATL